MCARLEALDKGVSRLFADSVFTLAKRDFEKTDPSEMRAKGADAALQFF
jgi:hypothetical protein